MKPPALPKPPHQNAANALIAAAFFAGIILATLLYIAVQSSVPFDTFGMVGIAILAFVVICSATAATLLLRKKKAGLIFCWICVPILFLNFPIGTILAFYIASQVSQPEIKDVLS